MNDDTFVLYIVLLTSMWLTHFSSSVEVLQLRKSTTNLLVICVYFVFFLVNIGVTFKQTEWGMVYEVQIYGLHSFYV